MKYGFSNARASAIYGAAFSFMLAWFVFAPTLEAGFQSEDYTWLALGRLNDSPLPLLSGGILFVYFYRPIGLLLWWLTARAFGDDALWHNAVDLFLHASDAALLCLAASRLAGRSLPGWIAGSLFATLPAGTGTASWMSDRFDPLALLFSLLAVLAFTQAPTRNRSYLSVFAFLLLALLSKEVAFATAGALALMLAWLWLRQRVFDMSMALAIVGAASTALALRLLSGTVSDTADTSLAAFWHGVAAWWRHAPEALTGPGNDSFLLPISATLVLLISIAAGLRHLLRAERGENDGALLLLCAGVSLLVLPAVLQWPVTGAVLFNAPNLVVPENLRFYYFAAAGLAAIAGAGTAMVPKRWSFGMLVTASIACASAGGAANDQAKHRAASLRPPYEAARTLASDLSQRDFPSACIIQLEAPTWAPAERQHSDSAIKALSPVNASVQNCAIFAGRSPSETLSPVEACTEAYWPGLRFAQYHGHSLARVTGRVCTLQFDRASAQALNGTTFHFQVSSDGHMVAR